MYSNGEGVAQDYSLAASWYQPAAAQGNEAAQSMLGLMYQVGQGVPQDYVLAYMWINLAANSTKSRLSRRK